eukprot:59184-Alexandrium_andersonii.AAC.1
MESSPKRAGRACNRTCCANMGNDVPRGQACDRRAACCVYQANEEAVQAGEQEELCDEPGRAHEGEHGHGQEELGAGAGRELRAP